MEKLEEHFLKKVITLILDYDRTNCYNKFLKKYAKDKIVVDCGSGSGILSWLALRHGAKEAHALEIIPSVLEHLNLLSSITPNLYVKDLDILTEDLPRGDLYIHEIFGNTIFDEGVHHLVSNCKRQGITNLYPQVVSLYAASSQNFHIRRFDKNRDSDKFNLELLDPEVREFITVLENNFYGKLDYCHLLESGTAIAIVDDESNKNILLDKTGVLTANLFDIAPADLPKLSKDIISWGFQFDDKISLNLDSCQLTTWSQTIPNEYYKSQIRRILPTKNYHHKKNRLKAYEMGVAPGSIT